MFATLLKKEVTAFFIIFLVTSTLLVTLFTPRVAASPTTIVSIKPSGYVAETVQVNGTIDTVNGEYNIFFDEELVVNGTASQNAVNTTFLIPHRHKGSYTIRLYDVKANNSASKDFTVETGYHINAIIPPEQTQLMEGQSATIRVSVTGGEENKSYWANSTVKLPEPVNTIYINSSLQLVRTTHPGEYVAESVYPRDFGSGAHTNYVGNYTLAFNATAQPHALAEGFFIVGLTNATEYHRFDTVAIQGAGYTQPDEGVWINIINSTGGIIFSKNVNATGGIVTASWVIPWNATYGRYNVTLTSSTSPGTVKPINDTQIFNIAFVVFPCQIHVKNLDNESVSNVKVEVWNGTQFITDDLSDKAGMATFSLEAYTYSFKAFFKHVEVGNIPALNVGRNITQTLGCQLANIKLLIKDETENPLPFIAIDVQYNYTRRDGTWISDKTSFETDHTGIINFYSTLTKISYLIEAKRYGYIFNRTSIGNLTSTQWINITCPTHTLFVHVVDSKEIPLANVSVNVTEWSSGLLVENRTWITNSFGSISLNLTFGKYTVKVYNYDAELGSLVVLNDTMIEILDWTDKKPFEAIRCKTVNLSPSVLVIDYFGQPIPNAEVKIERFSEINQKWVEVTPRRTDSSGFASLPRTGGNYAISISVMGQIGATKSSYIDDDDMLVFKMDKYVTISGFILETSQLVICIALGLLIISLGTVLAYKKTFHKITKK